MTSGLCVDVCTVRRATFPCYCLSRLPRPARRQGTGEGRSLPFGFRHCGDLSPVSGGKATTCSRQHLEARAEAKVAHTRTIRSRSITQRLATPLEGLAHTNAILLSALLTPLATTELTAGESRPPAVLACWQRWFAPWPRPRWRWHPSASRGFEASTQEAHAVAMVRRRAA